MLEHNDLAVGSELFSDGSRKGGLLGARVKRADGFDHGNPGLFGG